MSDSSEDGPEQGRNVGQAGEADSDTEGDPVHNKGPLSVRDLMGPVEPDTPSPEEVEASLRTAERIIEGEGVSWRAEEGGRATSGRANDSGAPLLRIIFFRTRLAGTDGSNEEARPDREVLTVARRLDDLSHHQLVDLLDRSRPWRSPEEVARGAGPAPGIGPAGRKGVSD